MKKLYVMLFVMCMAGYSYAEVDSDKLYLGGGLSLNSLSGIDFSDGIGLQVFAGYKLPVKIADGSLSVEAGYMDSGDMDSSVNIPGLGVFKGETEAKGVWVNAVIDLLLKDKLSFVGRAGLDLGDDDGIMLGGGLGLRLDEKMQVRAEYVIRDHVDSLQVNLIIGM
ncbi:MAG: outer membrane beta-barrel protein [Gammaproteobacteria bacterium]|nr:outer membrane beta-barrel protein [Gammaproteobacteria bacterium]MCW8923916.1 outer membrane beta-barrel protein [Gammaproteobacteria bacterium]